ncbi:MAG: nicotinate-nucleotide adenylyltransferase [Chloroflexota bacterium]|nr:nicotinate-nucleotide adenylyltransferase [Dehalococcoidia bacterium]MDW8046855.1 nicotinate-nucleotide adenylyltransferase [Chloroflexota bacterium]
MPRDAGPIGIFGGTFDPPHIGHLLAAEYAREQLGLREVRFLPAGYPYRKAGRRVSPPHHRAAMTELALAGHPAFVLDRRELEREGPTYTVDTLEELLREGYRDLVLLFGSDAVADMPNWKEPVRLFELARVAVFPKGCEPVPHAFEGRPLILVEMPRLEISSTLIRARVAAGRTIRHLVPDAVAAYIEAHGLYRPEGSVGGV